ncbi:carbohydrate sulfotransferase 1 [Plakobranchus ocellatus]|uniref:Carbohydrate sulfotransferase 1 n=1 Tax=Plakobranchus ocellatus TaxID=259542 RepID=A0AAV4D0B6_9GAST|nr:carbohydrate sulfotransferase 1 [Plakobranchus ocellatus]
MHRRFMGMWQYGAIFCVTFLVTFILIRESQIPRSSIIPQGSLPLNFGSPMDLEHKRQADDTSGSREEAGNPTRVRERKTKLNKTKECMPGSPRLVIMLTYGRSGSSLTSDIINEHPDVFFYYEPLHNLAKSFGEQQNEYMQKHKKYLHLTEIAEYNNAAVRMLEKQLTCQYHRLSRYATLNLHAPVYQSTKPLYRCIKNALTSKNEESCLLEAQESCEKKSIRFIKTIRFSVLSATLLMEKHPCLKLIYLVRDPRGSYYSKSKMFTSHGSNVTSDAARFCIRLDKDVDNIVKLKERYPERVLMTRFETIASHPIVSAKSLYEFLGMSFNKHYALFVYNKTHSQTEACYKWREKIPYNYVEEFDNHCSDPFFKLGYLPANSVQDLRNLKKALLFHKDNFS